MIFLRKGCYSLPSFMLFIETVEQAFDLARCTVVKKPTMPVCEQGTRTAFWPTTVHRERVTRGADQCER